MQQKMLSNRTLGEPNVLKILNVIASVDPAQGGPVEFIRSLSAPMLELGIDMEVASADDSEAIYVQEFPCAVHALGPSYGGAYRYTPRLESWIRANHIRYDAVLLHGIWDYASFGAWRGLKGSTTPYAVFSHGMLDPWFRKAYPLKHFKKQLYWILASGRVLRDSAVVLFTCAEERRLAEGAFFGFSYKSEVIAFGTADVDGDPAAQKRAFIDVNPTLEGARFLLFLSRIHEKKGCDLLIEAYVSVAYENPDIYLVIAGPDQIGLKAKLQNLVQRLGLADRILWPGMLTGEAKWGAFRSAEVFVLPSHQENFGIVLAEAMACGTPVLTTDKVNIWREIADSEAGFVEPDTKDGISRLLSRWVELDVSARTEMRKKARAAFEMHFAVEQAARDLAEVLRSLSLKDRAKETVI